MTDLVKNCDDLAHKIASEGDARARMKFCRQAIGLGQEAVRNADDLSDEDILSIQSMLRRAQRASKGTYNTNASITKLAKERLKRMGITTLPFAAATRVKRIGTDTACIAISGKELPDGWWDTKTALKGMNNGDFAKFGIGADGSFSAALRHLNMDEAFLDPAEYKHVLEAGPVFRLRIDSGAVMFGAAERLSGGVRIPISNGTYCGQIMSLRSGRGSKFIATLMRPVAAVDPFYQVPDLTML